MSEAWEFYECQVDGHRAILALDLAVGEAGPDTTRPVTVRITVPLLAPRPDGLPSSEERPRLNAIEHVIAAAFTEVGAVQVGRASFGGAMRLYFYARTADDARAAATKATVAVTDRALEVGGYEDPAWEQYFEFLYPNELGWQFINDRRVLDALREAGDQLDRPRPVDHTAYFSSAAERDAFGEAVTARGFRIDAADGDDSRDDGFRLAFSHDLSPLDIFGVTIELHGLAASCGGRYDGWGCPVTS